MAFYERKPKKYYRKFFREESDRLFTSAWKKYLLYQKIGAIDNPKSDEDICDWIDSIIGEKVNDNHSQFYIYG